MFSALKAVYRLFQRCLTGLYPAYLRLLGVECGKRLVTYGFPYILPYPGSGISLGRNLVLRSSAMSNPVGLNHRCIIRTIAPGARIKVGDNVSMSGATLLARTAIAIGNNVMIGANCTIVDSDLHPRDPEQRASLQDRTIPAEKVTIEDGVWLGMATIVLKGVTIGRNTVVGAGSVVSRSLPANIVAAGNPARVLKEL